VALAEKFCRRRQLRRKPSNVGEVLPALMRNGAKVKFHAGRAKPTNPFRDAQTRRFLIVREFHIGVKDAHGQC
jgi:hypothetical protein